MRMITAVLSKHCFGKLLKVNGNNGSHQQDLWYLVKKQFRYVYISHCMFKIVPNNLKGKSKSSQEWLSRQLNDPYVKKSRYENYRARSAFKLLEIDDRYKILSPGMHVVECGAAPGSWTQVLVKRINSTGTDPKKSKGVVIALDLNHFEPVEGAIALRHADFTKSDVQDQVCSLLPNKKADAVLSDMAPNSTGVRILDHEQITLLIYCALKFALKNLKPGGTFLCKLLDGQNNLQIASDLQNFFTHFNYVKPGASRTDSAEVFLLARDFKGVVIKEK